MLSQREKELFQKAKEYAINEIEPQSFYYETHPKEAKKLLKQLEKDGYCGIDLPSSLGGQAFTYKETALVYEAFSHGSSAVAFYLQLHNNITLMVERLNQSQHIKNIVEKMIKADYTNNFCLTEESSGSDPASTKSYCVEEKDGYHVYGMKDWIANAIDADYFVVMVNNGQPKGMNILLMDRKLPGISVERKSKIITGEILGTGKIFFDNVIVPKNMLLSENGFKESLVAIDVARLFVPAMCVGLAQRSIDLTAEYLASRESMGKPILFSQGIQWELAEMLTKVEAARQLVYHTAETKDSGEELNILGAKNKLFATDIAMEVTTKCMQFMGANGLYEDSRISRNWKMAKLFNITDGTGEIQKFIIGRSIYRNYQNK